MKLKLNKWQVVLLFLPFVAFFIISQIPYTNRSTSQAYFRIENLLVALNLCLIICYQAYLAISFNNDIGKESNWFSINAWIPIAFTNLHLIYVLYYTFVKQVHSNVNNGPIKKADFNPVTIAITIFLLHAGITFFFINNQFVSRRIKDLADINRQEQLKATYLNQMNWLKKVSIVMIIGLIVLSVIFDIVKFNI